MVHLAAGQRISVLVKTKPTSKLNYYFHANMDPVMFDEIPDDLQLSKNSHKLNTNYLFKLKTKNQILKHLFIMAINKQSSLLDKMQFVVHTMTPIYSP